MEFKDSKSATFLNCALEAIWRVRGILLSSITLIVLWPVIPSAFSGDDTFDSFIPHQLKFSHESPWTFIDLVTNNWKVNEGRYFPGAVTIGVFAHYFFPERAAYKLVQLFVALLVVALFYVLVKQLTRNSQIASISTLVVLCSTQIHVQYDPIIQFSLQQPVLMVLVFTSLILFILGVRHESWIYLFGSAVIYLGAMLTYETTVLLWPIFPLILFLHSNKQWKMKLLGTCIAPGIVVLNLMYWRSKVTNTAPGYTSNFSLEPLMRTFGKQSIAAIPMSFAEVNTPPYLLAFPHHLQAGMWFWWAAIISAGLLMMGAMFRMVPPSFRTRIVLIGIGLVLWLMPALVVAQTVRWQDELVLGNGYITAYQGYFGFALASVGVLLEIVARLQGKSRAIMKPLFAVVTVLIMVSISSVVINNRRAVAQYDAGSLWPREHFQRAIEAGVFSSVQDDSVVFTPQGEWWFNAPFVHWYGGPHVKTLISGRDEINYSSCLSDLGSCQSRLAVEQAFFTYGRYLNEPRVTIVGALVKMTGTGGQIKGIRIDSSSVYIDYPTASTSISDSEARCKSWLSNRMENIGVSTAITQIEVERATMRSCLAKLPSDTSFNPQLFTP